MASISMIVISQDYDQVSHAFYVAFVNLMLKWRNLKFEVESERQIFDKLFMPCSDKHFYCVKHNISHNISINYCSIKMQIVIILRKILNAILS